MARLQPGTNPPCPFCGALPLRGIAADDRGHIDWCCGSHQYGEEPWQWTNCETQCEVNELEASRDAWRKACRCIYEAIVDWPGKCDGMDKKTWHEIVRLIGEAENTEEK